MNDADAVCYSQRYNDLDGMEPRKHYMLIGKAQGRLSTCSQELTDYMAQRYVNQYPILQHSIGRSGSLVVAQAKINYDNVGYDLKRDISIPSFDEIVLCGAGIGGYNNMFYEQSVQCSCKGTLWYGLQNSLDDGHALTKFDQFRQWATYSKVNPETYNSYDDCSYSTFGLD